MATLTKLWLFMLVDPATVRETRYSATMQIQTPHTKDISLVFPSGEMSVRQALSVLREKLQQLHLDEHENGTVEIVLGEVFNNVVEHAYGPETSGSIEMRCVADDEALHFQVVDAGAAMPGLTPPDGRPANVDCALEELPEGGFGWFLVRELTGSLEYRREEGRNILTFDIPLCLNDSVV